MRRTIGQQTLHEARGRTDEALIHLLVIPSISIGYVEMIKAGRLNENYGLFGYGVSNSEVPNFKISRRQRVGDGGASFVGTGDVDELKAGLRA